MTLRQFAEKIANGMANEGQAASGSIITIIELLLPVIIELIQGCTEEGEVPVKMITQPNLLERAVLRQAVNRDLRWTGRGWLRRAKTITGAILAEASQLGPDEIKELLVAA